MKIPIALLFALCLSAHGQAVRNLSGQATNLTAWGAGATNTALRIPTNGVITWDASAGMFAMQVDQSTFDSVVDDILFWGYNYGPQGTAIDPTMPSIGMQFESNFRSGGANYSEWSINSTSLANGFYRWAALSTDRDNPTNGTSYWNLYVGTGGGSGFNVVRAQDNVTVFRVAPQGTIYATSLDTPTVQATGQALLLRGGTSGFVYVRQDISGISFGPGANSTISQAANISSLNFAIGVATPSSITMNTNGNVGIGASSAVPSARLAVNGAIVATNGVASFSSITPVTIDATGWTNVWATNNAIVMFSGTTMFFTNVLRANTPWFTNGVAHTGGMEVTLQPGEAIRIAGTGVAGRAKPF